MTLKLKVSCQNVCMCPPTSRELTIVYYAPWCRNGDPVGPAHIGACTAAYCSNRDTAFLASFALCSK